MEFITSKMHNISFKLGHRSSSKDFERERKLSFSKVLILLLQKSVKSLQLVLNEFSLSLDNGTTATASAYSQARRKLLHTAFIELNDGIVDLYYDPKEIQQRLWGFRVCGIDGSKVRLPNTAEIRESFGSFRIANQTEELEKEYPAALASVCYDVLNDVAITAEFAHGKSYEVELAKLHLSKLSTDDLLLFDRGYASYYMLANLINSGINFVIRCPKSSFSVVNRMFEGGPWSREVTLEPPKTIQERIQEEKLPNKIRVRFVRVVLSTGENEVLVTSLLDKEKYKRREFHYVYGLRWGVETFYGMIKGRLSLENFTGKSVESVKQDFYVAIFLSNVETIFTQDAQEILKEKSDDCMHEKAVNKAVSFNAIKSYAFDLFYEPGDLNVKMDKLTKLFLMNPVSIRRNRKVPRQKPSSERSLHYQKRVKKVVF